MSVTTAEELAWHVGHRIECVVRGTEEEAWGVAIECESCGVVLFDFDTAPTDLEEEDDAGFWPRVLAKLKRGAGEEDSPLRWQRPG